MGLAAGRAQAERPQRDQVPPLTPLPQRGFLLPMHRRIPFKAKLTSKD